MITLAFTVPGVATKGSWTPINTKRGVVLKNDNPRYRRWAKDCGWLARGAMTAQKLTPLVALGPVGVRVTFQLRSIERCDIDKLLRAVLDGLTGIVYRDDRQVAIVDAMKERSPDGSEATTISATFDETEVGPAQVAQPARRANARHGQAAARARHGRRDQRGL